MAFWYRIRPSKLKTLPTQFKRCYLQIPGPCLANHAALHPKIWVLEKQIHRSNIEFSSNVRFFAAPVQVKPKQEERDTSGPRLNEQIRADVVRLVTDEGHRVLSRSEALEFARNLKLDLVEVQRDAKPPVCKVMDYHKEKYKQQIREKERAKSKSDVTLRKGDCKEVRFSGKTEQKDLQIKADTVKRLMERGYRVKCMAQGTEAQDLGQLLLRLSALIEDISVVESGPRVEKKQAYIIVRHVKFGPSKKGSGKKASKVSSTTTSPEVQNIATSTPSIEHSPIHREEILDPAESGLETEDEILSEEEDTHVAPSLEMPDKDVNNKNPSWSISGANDEFDSVFDFGDDTKIASSSEVGTENRYRREPKKGTGARDAMRSTPPFPNQHRQPQFGLNPSPWGRESNPGGTNGSLVGNLKIPANVPKQERQHARAPAPCSPVSGYGIFSATEGDDASEKNSAPAEVNRYKKGSGFDSTRQPWPRGVSARQNSPTSNLDGSRGRPGVDKRWVREMENVR